MTDLYVTVAGAADAPVSLVFMHGTGFDHSYFRPYVDELAADYRLVFYDHRLNGRSSRDNKETVTLATLATDAEAVIREYCSPIAVVVAHSFGAWVALKVAEESPLLVHGIVLVGAGLSPTVGETLQRYMARHGTASQQQAIALAFGGQLVNDQEFAAAFRRIFPLYLSGARSNPDYGMVDRIRYSLLGFEHFLANGFGHLDWQSALRQFAAPVLVIAGSDDWLETDLVANSSVIAEVAGQSSFVALPRCGHFPFAEQPGLFCQTLRAWLTSLPTRAGAALVFILSNPLAYPSFV